MTSLLHMCVCLSVCTGKSCWEFLGILSQCLRICSKFVSFLFEKSISISFWGFSCQNNITAIKTVLRRSQRKCQWINKEWKKSWSSNRKEVSSLNEFHSVRSWSSFSLIANLQTAWNLFPKLIAQGWFSP